MDWGMDWGYGSLYTRHEVQAEFFVYLRGRTYQRGYRYYTMFNGESDLSKRLLSNYRKLITESALLAFPQIPSPNQSG